MKTKRIYTLVLASLLLAGCQSSSVLSQNSQADLKMEAAYDSGSAYERSAEGAAADTEQAPSEEMTGSSEWTESGDDSSMIVYTADITLQTRDYKKTWSEIKELILQYGGYIVSENLSNRSAGDASKPYDGQEEEGQVSSGFYSNVIKLRTDSSA